VVFFHTPITPVKGGGGSAARGKALSPVVMKELEVSLSTSVARLIRTCHLGTEPAVSRMQSI